MKTIEDLSVEFKGVDGVISTNVWEKHGKSRIYIELPKLNGGKKWNGGKAGTCFYENGEFVWKNWAGAKTRDRGFEIIENLKKIVS